MGKYLQERQIREESKTSIANAAIRSERMDISYNASNITAAVIADRSHVKFPSSLFHTHEQYLLNESKNWSCELQRNSQEPTNNQETHAPFKKPKKTE